MLPAERPAFFCSKNKEITINVFSFTGNLGRDAETRYTANGTAVCSFSVAVSSSYGDRKTTTWVRCALFGKRAEGQLVDYLKKGTHVAISGEATLREWEKDGEKRYALEVNVDSLDLIGGRGDTQSKPGAAPQPSEQKPQQESFDDDIPF